MRVILADDAILVRQGVARLLEDAGFEVVAQMADATELLSSVDTSGLTSSSSTSACRPPTRPRVSKPAWRSRLVTLTSVYWCSLSIWSPTWP